MSDIRVTFVLPTDATDVDDASETMIQAYESCKQLVDNISWATESELRKKKFDKLDYVVFESFEGKDFSKLIESKAAVVGPMAVSICLMEGKPIPSFQWPILNVAMYGCQVTCSQITKSNKEVIKNKVQLMGGLYTGDFTSSITHLICNGTKSDKYMLAAERNVKLMLPDWIDHIFEGSKTSNINANDPQILKTYRCLPFHNLTICTTGLTNSKEKARLSEVISANGGKLVAKLNLAATDILICHGVAGTTSDKYKGARRSRIPCVTINWIYDSVEKGYALPHENYYIKTVTSTPTKEGENIDPNFSTVSCIGTLTMQQSTINETTNTTLLSTTATVAGSTKASNKRKASDDLVEKIDIKKVKKAGQFLDGCSIFVVGFSPEHRDKLNKVVNLSGATRYDEFSDRVTHIIVGDPTCHEMRVIKAKQICCALVSVEWLRDSAEQHRPAKEDNYLIAYKDVDDRSEKDNVGSPLSKKALSLLKSPLTTVIKEEEARLQKPAVEQEDAFTQQYIKNATSEKDEDTLAMLLRNQEGTSRASPVDEFRIRSRPFQQTSSVADPDKNQSLDFKPHETSTQVSQVTSDISENDTDYIPIFLSHTFFLTGFDEEDTDTYSESIVGVGGTVVDKHFKGVVDYAVVPMFNQPKNLPAVQEVVNGLWIIQSIADSCLCDIKYFHRPMTMPSSKPLKECVVTLSVYTGQERHFLKSVIEELGGIFQEQFSRKNIPAKDVIASTHLVSPEASGKKYDAAVKWNLPVVNKDWLLECARTGTKVDVDQYLLSNNTTCHTLVNNDSKKSMASSNNSGLKLDKEGRKSPNPNDNDERKNLNTTEDHNFTPKYVKTIRDDPMKTPKQQIYNLNQNETPDASSQVTPVNTVLQRFKAINGPVLPTPSPKTYYPWNPKTPDTPIGAFIRDNPSPRLRKEMEKYVNSFPEFVPPRKRRTSTPLSELKKRLRNKVLGTGEYSQSTQDEAGPSTQVPSQDNEEPRSNRTNLADINFDDDDDKQIEHTDETPIVNVAVQQKLQELQQMVMANGSSSATRRTSRMFEASTNPPGIVTSNNEVQSQVCTVGWDYGEGDVETQPQKLFLLSGIEASLRNHISDQLKSLGGIVLDASKSYEASCTHLICPKPGANEKTLACMASGKWILHFSYVEKCVKAGKFLDEEEFEFGNPKARQNILCEENDGSFYFWRKEIKRRGYGAFNDMRAIVIAEKKESIINVIEAGGGVVVNVRPPFSDSIHATHCLLEMQKIKDISQYVPLAQQGIKCVNTIYIKDFLWRKQNEESDYIIPYFAKYY